MYFFNFKLSPLTLYIEINPDFAPQNKYFSSDDIVITTIGFLYSEKIHLEILLLF